MGIRKKKAKMIKPSEKFRNIFNFEWDESEDTSYDANPLYNNPHFKGPLFGKGIIGGVDIEEQLKKAVSEKKIKNLQRSKNASSLLILLFVQKYNEKLIFLLIFYRLSMKKS